MPGGRQGYNVVYPFFCVLLFASLFSLYSCFVFIFFSHVFHLMSWQDISSTLQVVSFRDGMRLMPLREDYLDRYAFDLFCFVLFCFDLI